MDAEPDAGVKELPNGGFDVPATAEPDPEETLAASLANDGFAANGHSTVGSSLGQLPGPGETENSWLVRVPLR